MDDESEKREVSMANHKSRVEKESGSGRDDEVHEATEEGGIECVFQWREILIVGFRQDTEGEGEEHFYFQYYMALDLKFEFCKVR